MTDYNIKNSLSRVEGGYNIGVHQNGNAELKFGTFLLFFKPSRVLKHLRHDPRDPRFVLKVLRWVRKEAYRAVAKRRGAYAAMAAQTHSA